MGQNLKPYVAERQHMTARDILENLVIEIPGKSIGEFYIVGVEINDCDELELEVDDGCRFVLTCRRMD